MILGSTRGSLRSQKSQNTKSADLWLATRVRLCAVHLGWKSPSQRQNGICVGKKTQWKAQNGLQDSKQQQQQLQSDSEHKNLALAEAKRWGLSVAR